MNFSWSVTMVVLLAYLFGSIPVGVLLARRYGVEIRSVGSGNIGATNVLRSLGWGPGLIVVLFDIFKGGIAVLVARLLGVGYPLLGAVAFAAVLGHNFSVFLRFKGGKGVATSFGTLLFLDPVVAVYTLPIALATMALTRFVSAGSIIGILSAIILAVALGRGDAELATVVALAALISFTHWGNIVRLQQGTERRLSRGGAERSKPKERTERK